MPLNQLKKYNQLLELESYSEADRKKSLMAIFNRDIAENTEFCFQTKPLKPTPLDGEIKMETLYTHLTCVIGNKKERNRVFDIHRAKRLHWVRFHVEEKKQDNMLIFTVSEPDGLRTYIYDKDEKYVIVLEPLRKINAYYLLSAYFVRGKDAARNKFEKKYKRRLQELH